MKWRDVQPGMAVTVGGETWAVLRRDGDTFALRHPILGERDGTPDLDSEVTVSVTPTEAAPAKPRYRNDERTERIVEGERRKARLAKATGTTVEAVDEVQVRLTLGATLIAHLRPTAPPATPKVEVMDLVTLRAHVHFFHDHYPSDEVSLEALTALHERLPEHERHEHVLPF